MMTGSTRAEALAEESLQVAKESVSVAKFSAIVTIFFGIVSAVLAVYVIEVRRSLKLDNEQPVVEVRCVVDAPPCLKGVVPDFERKPAPIIKPTPPPSDDQTIEDGSPDYYATVDTRNNSGLNVRAAKDIASSSVVFVNEDEQVGVISCEDETVVINSRPGNWCLVTFQGVEGWAFSAYIGIEPKTTDIISSNDSNQNYRYIVDTRNDSGLNLRATKNLDAASVAFAEEGEEVTMLYCENESVVEQERAGHWCRIEYDNVEGWAWGWFLDRQLR